MARQDAHGQHHPLVFAARPPHDGGKPPAWLHRPAQIRERGREVVEEHDPEARVYEVETLLERVGLGVGAKVADAGRRLLARDRQHRFGDVDADRLAAERGELDGRLPETASHVERKLPSARPEHVDRGAPERLEGPGERLAEPDPAGCVDLVPDPDLLGVGHGVHQSIRTTPSATLGNFFICEGSWPGTISSGFVASFLIRSCARRFALASSVCAMGACVARFSYRYTLSDARTTVPERVATEQYCD